MAECIRKIQRLAVGTFVDVDRLDQTLQELVTNSFDPDQFCLIASEPVVDSVKKNAAFASPSHLQVMLDHTHSIATPDSGQHLVVSPDLFDGLDFAAEWQDQGILHGLEEPLNDGAIALIVKTRTIAQFAAVTRALLRTSSHSVRTREIVDRS